MGTVNWRAGVLADPAWAQNFLQTLPESQSRRFATRLSTGLLAPPASEDDREDLVHELLGEGIQYYFRVLFAAWRAGYDWEEVSQESLSLATNAMKQLACFFLSGPIQESWAPPECLKAVDALGDHMVSSGLQDTVLLFVDELTGLLVNPPPQLPLWEMEFCCLGTVMEDHQGSFLQALAGVERDVMPWVLGMADPLRDWAS